MFLGLCRGVIGSGQRVCLRSDCSIASHTSKKVDWASLAGDETQCVFIRGSGGSEGDENPTIFATPTLPSSLIREAEWSELETSPRSLESWQATFSSLKESAMAAGNDAVDGSVVAHVLQDTKSGINFVYTPARKKVRLQPRSDDSFQGQDVASGSSDGSNLGDTFASVKMEKAAASVSFIDVPEDLGNQPTPAFRTLSQGAWRDLLSNVAALKTAVEEEKLIRRSFRGKHDEQLDSVHMKLSVLHELLGERPTSFGTLSAFGLIDQLTSSTHTLASMLEDIKKSPPGSLSSNVLARISTLEGHLANLKTNVEKIVMEQIERFMTTGDFRSRFVEPTMRLLTRSSLTSADPGGKWDGELRDLKRRIGLLEAGGSSGATGTQSTTPSMFAWGTTSSSSLAPSTPASETPATGGSVVTALKEEIAKLKADVKDLQEQSESDAIVVGSIVFSSRKACDTWLALHTAVGDPHVFVDAISLLSLATSDASLDEGQAANQRATTARVKDKTPYHTAYIASFNLEVPPLLGKSSDSSMTINSRALAGVPKFVDFHPPSGREGIHQRVLDYVKDGRKTLEQAIGDLFAFGSEPSSVARELLLLSKTFWDELCHWMVRYHREIKEESDASEHEVWILISHCVRAVFKSLRDARAPGRASNSPGGMLWGTLKAHETMREYRSHDFSGHPKIALILHEHLIRFSTPRSKFDELRVSFDEKLEKVARSVNQVVSSVNKKGSGGGNKSGSNGEAKK